MASGCSKPVPIVSTVFPPKAWSQLAVDFHGPLSDGQELMVVIDEHSKFPVVSVVKSTAAHHVIPELSKVFSLMGIPKTLKTDNGPPFQGFQFKEFCSQFGICHRKITPLWPQANGQVENFNRNINGVIKKSFIMGSNWREELEAFLRSYRNTPTWGMGPQSLLLQV